MQLILKIPTPRILRTPLHPRHLMNLKQITCKLTTRKTKANQLMLAAKIRKLLPNQRRKAFQKRRKLATTSHLGLNDSLSSLTEGREIATLRMFRGLLASPGHMVGTRYSLNHPPLSLVSEDRGVQHYSGFAPWAKPSAQVMWILITVTGHVLFHFLILWSPRLTDLLSIVILTGLPTCYIVARPHTSRINLSLVILTGVPLMTNSCPQIGIWPNLCKLLMLEHHPPELLPL